MPGKRLSALPARPPDQAASPISPILRNDRDRNMNRRNRGAAGCLAATLLTLGAWPADAQEPAGAPVAADMPAAQAATGLRMGSGAVDGFADILVPIARSRGGQSLFFLNPRLSLAEEGDNGASLGLVWRRINDDRNRIVGANVFHDSLESRHGNRFNQWGFGLETLGERVDARINWYRADSDPRVIDESSTREVDTETSVSTSQSVSTEVTVVTDTQCLDPYATGHTIYQDSEWTTTTTTETTTRTTTTTTTATTTTERFYQQFEGALEGYDAEIGVKLPIGEDRGNEVRLFAGRYDFEGEFGAEVKGNKARLEVRAGPHLTFDLEAYDDDSLYGTDYFAGLRLHIPIHHDNTWKRFRESFRRSEPREFAERQYADMVMRDGRTHLEESDFIEDASRFNQWTEVEVTKKTRESTTVETETESGTDTEVILDGVTFVDGDNAGDEDGTFEKPYNGLQEGLDEGAIAGNNTVFLCGIGDGNLCDLSGGTGGYDEIVTMHDNQTLTSTVEAKCDKCFETVEKPRVAPTTAGFDDAVITLADNTTVNRIWVDGSASPEATGIVGWLTDDDDGGANLIDNTIETSSDYASGVYVSNEGDGDIVLDGNTVTTNGYLAEAFLVDNYGSGGVRVTGNEVTTYGEQSEGVYVINLGIGDVEVGGNTIHTEGYGAQGVYIGNEVGGDVAVESNLVTTSGQYAPGIFTYNEGPGDTTISGNTVSTSGEASDAVWHNDNGGGGTYITGNTITTQGDSAAGVFLLRYEIDDHWAGSLAERGSTEIAGNVITTYGEYADGIYADISFAAGDATDPADYRGSPQIYDNTITTSGDDAYGIYVLTDVDADVAGALSYVEPLRAYDNVISTGGEDSSGIVFLSGSDSDIGVDSEITGNTITTAGEFGYGIDWLMFGTGGDVAVSGNTVVTGENYASGILVYYDSLSEGTARIDDNTVTTSGVEADAALVLSLSDSAACHVIEGNTLDAQGSGVGIHVVNAVDVADGDDLAIDNDILGGGVVYNGVNVAACP